MRVFSHLNQLYFIACVSTYKNLYRLITHIICLFLALLGCNLYIRSVFLYVVVLILATYKCSLVCDVFLGRGQACGASNIAINER